MSGTSGNVGILVFWACLAIAASIKTRSFLKQLSTRSEDAGSQLSQADLSGCSYEVVMFDTRELSDIPSFSGKLFPSDQYQSMTAVINFMYAAQHGYEFTFVHMDKASMDPKYSIPWHRVFYFQDRLQQLKDDGSCKWFLYVDTDAFLHDFSTSLDTFITDMASKYNINKDVGAIFAQEQEHRPEMTWTLHAVNAGVYLVHSNEQSRKLFNTWSAAASDDPELMQTWPAEQGVLTELVFPGKFVTRQGKLLYGTTHEGASARLGKHDDVANSLALVNMTEMNSPWGRFVEHIWSGPGSQKRGTDFIAMLENIQASDPEQFKEMLNGARQHISDWSPSK